MKKISFFQARPVGEETGNYALDETDAEKLLDEYFDEYEIIETSNFGNGVLVKAVVDTLNLKYFKNSDQIDGKVKII